MAQREDSVKRLIDQCFEDWGAGGRPARPAMRREAVLAWLRELTTPHEAAAVALVARLRPIVDAAREGLAGTEGLRPFARFDLANLRKSPASILDKMARRWETKGLDEGPPPIGFRDLADEMSDLARFRLVANFLGDARRIVEALERSHGTGASALSAAQRALRDEFALHDNRFEDLVNVRPADRSQGERCFKGCYWPRDRSSLKVEVQVATVLSEAWDKKEHFLVYEPRRRGEAIDPDDERMVFACSETLYVIDVTFEGIRQRLHGGPTP